MAYLPGGSVWWGAYGGARAKAEQLGFRQPGGVGHGLPDSAERVASAAWASFCTVFVTSVRCGRAALTLHPTCPAPGTTCTQT